MMNILIWVFQALLAFIMIMAGSMKLTNTNAQLIEKGNGRMDWAKDVSASGLKFIGLVEVLAGLGLILPYLLNILPVLTPLAAFGVVLIMLGAMALHIKRADEKKSLLINLMIIVLASAVAYGRIEIFSL